MSRFLNLLNTAGRLLEAYQPGEPFHLYLKNYFARNRKHGSSDRRILRELCFSYFRVGQLGADLPILERIAVAYYLIHPEPMLFLAAIKPDWSVPSSQDPAIRSSIIGIDWSEALVFPWGGHLPGSVDARSFARSLLRQPDLFIRIRPGHEASVSNTLLTEGLAFRQIDPTCVALTNATDLERLFETDRAIVVQDRSSQRIRALMETLPTRDHWSVWDACAASGGKSILVFDVLKNCSLSCTDLRGSILRNLQARLERAMVPVQRVRRDDLTIERDRSDWGLFDLILADVPCTGSGTWARTPEQSYYFDATGIDAYVITQRSILRQLVKQLSADGYLLYMTCSIFKAENEKQVQWVKNELGLELISEKYFAGYAEQADTLFGALFKRSA